MIDVSMDAEGVKATFRALPAARVKAQVDAMKVGAFEFNKHIRRYATGQGDGSFRPYAPITPMLRKTFRLGYGQWFARFSFYDVSPSGDRGVAGMLGPGDQVGGGKVRPVGKAMAKSAKKHATGYSIRITQKSQRSIAKRVFEKGRYRKRAGSSLRMTLFLGIRSGLIPKIGWHRVKARPIVAPVRAAREREVMQKVRETYLLKLRAQLRQKAWTAPAYKGARDKA